MSQVLKSLQLATQSYSGTPSTGTGALFASGSVLHFENDAGTIFPLGATGGGSGYLIIREYTGSAPGGGTLTPTWNNNSSIKYIQVICVGAGGGGGSGAIGPDRASGGGGGGGGAIAWGFFDSASLTQASYPISIGAGGAGGGPGGPYAGGAGSNSGQSGSAGGYTTFGGNMVSASGGSGGGRGGYQAIGTGGAGGLSTLCLPSPGFAIPGGIGGSSPFNNSNATPPLNFFSTPLTPTSTAGGGAGALVYNLGGLVYFSGSLGASGFEWNTLKSNNTTYHNSGSNNIVTAAVLLQFTSSIITTTYGLGGGGNGGDIATTQVPGANGGLYGAGGAGSNARLTTSSLATGQTTQVGGSGSSGLCIVVEYY
jgi:hypothetical protein